MTENPSCVGHCRGCATPLTHLLLDLGDSPISSDYRRPDEAIDRSRFRPLRAYVCTGCFLVQLADAVDPGEVFRGFTFLSSTSESWLAHSAAFAEAAIERYALDSRHQVIEVASNDGYLLRFFRERSIPVLGIEPATPAAAAARGDGIVTLEEFFGSELATDLAHRGVRGDLLVANNVWQHVPDPDDFARGLRTLLANSGTLTMEFPHWLRTLEGNQFDNFYHETFSYFSLLTAERMLARHGLVVFDVEELGTHGGSLRIHATHVEREPTVRDRVVELGERERSRGLGDLTTYDRFAKRVAASRQQLREFVLAARARGESVAGYGAPAKANTLLHYCGLDADSIGFTVDRNPHKQGRLLPGTRIPIMAPEHVREARPDYLLILPWNMKDEIMEQMAHIREWGGRFIVPIPELQVIDAASPSQEPLGDALPTANELVPSSSMVR